MSTIKSVFENKRNCCGCGACVEICPSQAISMLEDKLGFKYPVVNQQICIGCKLCVQNCAFSRKKEYQKITAVYAATNKNEIHIENASSGGIFPAIAEEFLQDGGIVFGAELKTNGRNISVEHTAINFPRDIERLQGSKYVQSDITTDAYKVMREYLEQGRRVLFSGTPCQVAQVKQQFRKYEDKLYCVDIICHGVPNQRMFNEYMQKLCGQEMIESVTFRDKQGGWGLQGKVKIRTDKSERIIIFQPNNSSYYHYFLQGDIYRESCYSCPYAKEERVGDITIGDYWGIEKFNPELMIENGGVLNKKKGISCVLINNFRGEALLEMINTKIDIFPVSLDNVLKKNTQLSKPVKLPARRKRLLVSYRIWGYDGIDCYYMVTKMLHGFLSEIKLTIKKWYKPKR